MITFTISNVDVDKLKKYLYVEVYDEDDNLISECNEINIGDDKNILKPGENHIYKVIIMLKI